MKNVKSFRRLSVSFFFILLIIFPFQSAVFAKTVLKMGHIFPETMPVAKAAAMFAEEVKKRTNGNIEIKIYPASQLGKMKELFGQHKMGSIQMSLTAYPVLADVVPEYAVLIAGFLYKDWDHLNRVIEAPQFGRAWDKKLIEGAGLRKLYHVYYGVRHLTTSETPVYSPADLKGKKIRSVPNPYSMTIVNGLGATPTPVPFSETFNALRQGVVDGQENPLHSIWSMKFHEVQKYLILTGHQIIANSCFISENIWKKLSDSEKQAMIEAGKIVSEYGTRITFDTEAELLNKMKKYGMEVIGKEQGLNIDAFGEKTRKLSMEKLDGVKWPKGLANKVGNF